MDRGTGKNSELIPLSMGQSAGGGVAKYEFRGVGERKNMKLVKMEKALQDVNTEIKISMCNERTDVKLSENTEQLIEQRNELIG